jgi:hypothetical protein
MRNGLLIASVSERIDPLVRLVAGGRSDLCETRVTTGGDLPQGVERGCGDQEADECVLKSAAGTTETEHIPPRAIRLNSNGNFQLGS